MYLENTSNFSGHQTSPWNIAVVLLRKLGILFFLEICSFSVETRIFSVETRIFSVETRIVYVKNDTVARTRHLFSVETCSFSVGTRAFAVEYLFVYTTGGGGGGRGTQVPTQPCGLKGTL
jgi:hypothetical protein